MAGRVDVRPDVRGHLNFSNGDYRGPVRERHGARLLFEGWNIVLPAVRHPSVQRLGKVDAPTRHGVPPCEAKWVTTPHL